MSVTSAELWKLLQDSRLLSAAQLEQMESVFSQARNSAGQVTAESLVVRLLREDLLTRYQASQLLNGRAGPFIYGDYRVQDRLRGGPLHGLFRAVHGPTQFPVLLKFAAQRVVQDPRQWSIARQYHRSTVALVHSNLQRVYALEDCAGHRFLVLEDLAGETLERTKAIGSRLPPAEASRIIHMAARGLSAIHGQRQIYGDVQPANLWQDSTGNVKLLRDGVLPPVVPDFSRTDLPEAAVAQANYAAPELAHPGTSLSPLTDIYALGCTFYQLLTGEPPFAGGAARDKLERHATEPIAPLEPLGVPAPLARLVAFMMAKNPTIRTATAHDVVAQLAPFVESPADAISTPPWSSSRHAFEDAIAHPSAAPPAPPPILTNLPGRCAGPPAPPVLPPEPAVSAVVTGVAAAAPPTRHEAGPPPPPEITVASATDRPRTSLRTRRPRRSQRARALTLSLLAGALLATATAYVLWDPPVWSGLRGRPISSTAGVDAQSDSPREDTESTGLPGAPPTSAATGDRLFDVRPDDGTLLWMTPTQSQSIQLPSVPPGTQLLLVVRPHELASSAPGQLLLRAIDLDLSEYRQQWEAATGCSWQEIEQLVVSWRSAADTPQQPTMVVYLREPRTEEQLIAAWGNPPAVPHEDAHYFTAHGWSFYVPVADNKPTFIMGEEEAVREVIAMHGAPPVLRREMAQLLATSDAQHHITILGVPSYLYGELFRDGSNAWLGDASRVRKALEWLLGDQFTACQLGVYCGDRAYLELRGYGRTAADSRMLSRVARESYSRNPGTHRKLLPTSVSLALLASGRPARAGDDPFPGGLHPRGCRKRPGDRQQRAAAHRRT